MVAICDPLMALAERPGRNFELSNVIRLVSEILI